ncbi:hypothetical protein COHCIP112018_02357 [Cohnella sp. JJ-181]|nr:hypothetical protein COHCIP112018_02357 [Cohnella sp. JJ-181]
MGEAGEYEEIDLLEQSYGLTASHRRPSDVKNQHRRVVNGTMSQRVGEMLKASRERAGMTQQQLAMKLHVERSTIAKVETGAIKEPAYTLVREWCAATNGIDLMNLDFTGANDGWKKLRQLEAVMKNMKESMAAVHLMKRREKEHARVGAKIGALRGRI